ncbi:hypothetical protein [Phaeodactylibacter xiamenensis]|jgi:hypothetical protein|uniref:Outer membrane protein beta-barrel domain-containing protein n=1 Tax=Phaeodactylibacter xiamenensis TaxID=1524460 RepID=A0A098S5S7_9BACT|nr:hypothetical protein [Phaeodactylibacter xiamenensis]KGE87158.1 hypothetical protein IX84_16000 [Phaeodactylibacter xiamenensis]MCR9051337.1 hypothetical protein [bacterium]
MIKNVPLALLIIFFTFTSAINTLRAQALPAWSVGGSIQGGAGSSSYSDHPYLTQNREFGMVWHYGIHFNTWYQLTSRLSLGGGGGIRSQYFQLQTFRTLPDLASDIGFVPADEETDYYLARIKHNSTFLKLNLRAEYLMLPYQQTACNLGLIAGASLGVAPLNRIRTAYGELDPFSKNFLPRFGSNHLFDGIQSEAQIEDYFRQQLNRSLLFYQLGMVVYASNPNRPARTIRIALVYEGTNQALSQGFNSPMQGFSLNIGVRLNR